jgi:molybdate transport system substrate-binding protein
MQRAIQILVLALASLWLAACGGPESVTVFAAASLADAMEEVEAAWEADHPERPVELSFAGSQTLARQIAAGAPADLFVAADRDRLMAAERLVYEEAVPLLGNRLVVIVPAGVELSPADLAAVSTLALGDPEAGVPAGVYARSWLRREGLWDRLAPRVVATSDVRGAVAAVASGAAEAGVVYRTDVRNAGDAERLSVAFEVPSARAPRILYFAAPVTDVVGGAGSDGRPFLDFLTGPQAGEIFRRHGFEHLPAGLAGPPATP